MTERQTRYITTPIYYVNDRPHIGHVYTTTVCDVWARFMRFRGDDVFFLTGTDEHATKVVEAAAKRDLTAQQWADQNAAAFRETFADFNIANSDFIRTSEARHRERVERYVAALLDSGDVYLGEYVGWYDAGQEEYIPESKAREYDFASPINGQPLVKKTEQNYFFRLSKYREPLIAHFEANPTFVQPDARRNEILNRIADAEDIPMSRTGMTDWGIRVPGDEQHTIYVWIDALFNYLSTVDSDDRRQYWESQPIHVTAKDILWFHAAVWPAMLMALRQCDRYDWVALPQMIYAHSFYISEGQKMSKTLGNFIDLELMERYVERYSLDALRYYLATQGPLGVTDSDFSAAHFHEIYTSDLVNTLGNCASRVTAMIGKYCDGDVPDPGSERFDGYDWPRKTQDAVRQAADAMERFDLTEAIAAGMSIIREVDVFINDTAPFKLAKDPDAASTVNAILYQCAEAVRIASLLIAPACPDKVAALWEALGQDIDPARDDLETLGGWGQLAPGTATQKVALFPRVDPIEATAASV